MTIHTHVRFRQYLLLLFTLAYRKPLMWVIVFTGLSMWVWIAGYYTGLVEVPEPLIYQYITAILITLLQPTFIYFTVWQNYYSSAPLQEPVVITFTPECIKMRGMSFYTELVWDKLFKVVELKHWYLVYQNTLSAVIIPKSAFKKGEIEQFAELVSAVPGLSTKLKKEL
ncbi:MAG: YcxB family protein [Bacteroidota bacterium]